MIKKLVFVTEARFLKDKSNQIFCESSFSDKLWLRYLEEFDYVVVVARIKKVDLIPKGYINISKVDSIEFLEFPYYVGLKEYLLNYRKIKNFCNSLVEEYSNYSFILRVPGLLGYNISQCLCKKNISFGIEVVGDPEEVFVSSNFSNPLIRAINYLSVRQLKFIISKASCILYVTNETLQNKYMNDSASVFSVSDVILEDNLVSKYSKKLKLKKDYNVLCVGSLAQMYKAPDIMLKALNLIKNRGKINLNLVWLGDGEYKDKMINLSKRLDVSENSKFLGNVESSIVFQYMENSDLFVLPSRTEGLPRVVVEAMSKALPVVASKVGGIPELLEELVLVPKEDEYSLANMIENILLDENFYNNQSIRNLNFSHNFKKSILDEKRKNFYNAILHLKKNKV